MKQMQKIVLNPSGIHARPAAAFVNEAKKFTSRIQVTNENNGKTADAKSILKLMSLAMTKGTPILLRAEGEDEDAALAALSSLIDSGLGEAI